MRAEGLSHQLSFHHLISSIVLSYSSTLGGRDARMFHSPEVENAYRGGDKSRGIDRGAVTICAARSLFWWSEFQASTSLR